MTFPKARNDALLVFEDGTVFSGRSFGAAGTVFGEAVFTTAHTGYQEVLTDPSHYGHIVTMTAPHIGNVGLTVEDMESDRFQVAGFVVREAARRPSSWRSEDSLAGALADAGIVAVEGVDTRALTRHLREVGTLRAGLSTEVDDVAALLAQVRESPQIEGAELASRVTTHRPYRLQPATERRFRVVAIDLGMKRSIGRHLTELGATVDVLPASASADEVRAFEPDGVLLSNGPGDPAAVTQGITTTRALLGEIPMFGICLGSQLLAHAVGADTYKLRFGHRGVNQPVLRRADGTVEITSHNHGFAVQATTLGEQVDEHRFITADHGVAEVSYLNLNDDVCEGIDLPEVQAFGVQFHPEATPGPSDAQHLFATFAELMTARTGAGKVR